MNLESGTAAQTCSFEGIGEIIHLANVPLCQTCPDKRRSFGIAVCHV
jgi:hypothetical protein